MTLVALAALAVVAVTLVLVVWFGAGLLRSQQRAHTRERDLLLNQLLHATGKTWQPPPAAEPLPPLVPAELPPIRYTATPERFPA